MGLSILNFLKEYDAVLIPISTFVMGFIASRLTLSKKELLDHEQRQYENGKDLMNLQYERFQEFTAALEKYKANKSEPTFEEFYKISTIGEKYFYQLMITSEAILSGKVNESLRDDTLVPKIKEALSISIPAFYKTLKSIAEKNNIDYQGEFTRKNYESLFRVVEKYS